MVFAFELTASMTPRQTSTYRWSPVISSPLPKLKGTRPVSVNGRCATSPLAGS